MHRNIRFIFPPCFFVGHWCGWQHEPLILYIDLLLALPSLTSRVGLLEISNTTRCQVCSTGWNIDWDCFLFDLHFAAIFLRNKKPFRLPCPQLRNSARTCKFPFITLPHFYDLFYCLPSFTTVELWTTIFCDSCIVTDQLFFFFFILWQLYYSLLSFNLGCWESKGWNDCLLYSQVLNGVFLIFWVVWLYMEFALASVDFVLYASGVWVCVLELFQFDRGRQCVGESPNPYLLYLSGSELKYWFKISICCRLETLPSFNNSFCGDFVGWGVYCRSTCVEVLLLMSV